MNPVEREGKIEFEFGGKATVVDLDNVEDSLRMLVRIVVSLDRRVAAPEGK